VQFTRKRRKKNADENRARFLGSRKFVRVGSPIRGKKGGVRRCKKYNEGRKNGERVVRDQGVPI